jgi:hypothetical protein
VSPIASMQPDASEDIPGRAAPTCLENVAARASVNERMTLALEHCSTGLVSRHSPAGWKVVDALPSTVAEFAPDTPSCIRMVVVMNDVGQSARASIVDSSGRVFAKASGPNVLLVPEDGPLCVPSQVRLRFEVACATPPLDGVAALLESP